MLNRMTSAGLMAVLLSSSLPMVPLMAQETPLAPLAQARYATCTAARTALVETLVYQLGAGLPPEPTLDRLGQDVVVLGHQLRLMAQLPLGDSRINPLTALVNRLGTVTALLALEAAQQAELRSLLTPTADLVSDLGPERSAVKTQLLTQLAVASHRLGDGALAQGLLRQARQTVATIQGDDFKAQALMTIADSQAQTGERAAAIATLAEAFSMAQRIAPTPAYPGKRDDVLSRLVTAHSQLGAFSQAIAIANTLQDATLQGYAQMSLVQALLARAELELALLVADSMRQPELKAWALSTLGTYAREQGQDDETTALFNRALTTAFQPAQGSALYPAGVMAAQVVQAYSQGQPDAALALVPSLPHGPSRGLALMAIATAYRASDRIAQANGLLAEVLSVIEPFEVEQHRTVTNSMIAVALEAQYYDWALQLANQIPLTESAGNLREATLGQIIYTALGQGQLEVALQGIDQLPPEASDRNTWVHRAIALALQQDDGTRAEQIGQAQFGANAAVDWIQAQRAIAQSDYQAGQRDAALNRLLSVTEQINHLTDPAQKGGELVSLVATYAQLGEADLAAQRFAAVLQWAQATNETPAAPPAFLVGSTQPLLEAGLYEWAYQLAQTVPTYELQTPEPVTVMQAILGHLDVSLAERLIPTTRSPELKTQLFLALADHYIALDQGQRASATLAQAVTAARTIPDPEVRQTLVMGAAAYDYNDPSDRASQLEAIAQRYAYLNQREQANQTLSLIQSAELRRHLSQQLLCYQG